jgi:kinesin family protein 3/17
MFIKFIFLFCIEEVRDLLSSNPKQRLDIKEDPEQGVYIKGLTHRTMTSVYDMEETMANGNKNRSVGATAMNADSSRSHSLFMIRIEMCENDEHVKVGKLNLVDLAGSERQSKVNN